MAEDIRNDGAAAGDLEGARTALVKECADQARNTVYTSTSFYIWLRALRAIRAGLWIVAAIASISAASKVLSGVAGLEILVAGLTLLGVVLPGVAKAMKLDESIAAYEAGAAKFKHAESELRRAADVWSHKCFPEFEAEARKAFDLLEEARSPSLTPPEWCFRSAQKKVQSGDYDPD